MTATDLTLNAVDLSTAVPTAKVLNVNRPLLGSRRDRRVTVPGRAGAWTFTEEPGDRLITVILNIAASSLAERRTELEALADWADVGAVAQLIIDDQTDRYHDVILAAAPDVDDWLNLADIPIEFAAAPYAYAVSASSTGATATGGSDTDTFAASDDLEAEPIIELTAIGGTVDTFSLTLNGDALTYSGPSFAAGGTVTISTISDTVTEGGNGDTMLTGAYTGTVIMADVAGAFPLVDPGTNTWVLSWTGTATDIAITITWRRRYRR